MYRFYFKDSLLLETTFILGSNCTCCTCTKAQMNDPDYAESHWYPKNRSKDQNLALYHSLKKKPDGSIDTRVSTDKRNGMTQRPMGTMDWTGILTYSPKHCIFYIFYLF